MVSNKFLVLFPSCDKVIWYNAENFAIYFGLGTEVRVYWFQVVSAYVVDSAGYPDIFPKGF